jgi:hypothetical protein
LSRWRAAGGVLAMDYRLLAALANVLRQVAECKLPLPRKRTRNL